MKSDSHRHETKLSDATHNTAGDENKNNEKLNNYTRKASLRKPQNEI